MNRIFNRKSDITDCKETVNVNEFMSNSTFQLGINKDCLCDNSSRNVNTLGSDRIPFFHGDCTIAMDDGSLKYVQNLCLGDPVRTFDEDGNMDIGYVECVVETPCGSIQEKMVSFPSSGACKGLVLSPYNSVKLNGRWIFPQDIISAVRIRCKNTYSIILRKGGAYTVLINGILCITMGHNLTSNIVRHKFYGSDRVRNALNQHPNYTKGWLKSSDYSMVYQRGLGGVVAWKLIR